MNNKPIQNKTDMEKLIKESSESANNIYLVSGWTEEVVRLFDEGRDKEAVLLFSTAIEGLDWFSVFQLALNLMEPFCKHGR